MKQIILIFCSFLVLLLSYEVSSVHLLSFFKVLIVYFLFISIPGYFFFKLFRIKYQFQNSVILLSNLLGLSLVFIVDFLILNLSLNKNILYFTILFLIPIILFYFNDVKNDLLIYKKTSWQFSISFLIVFIFLSLQTINCPALEKVESFGYSADSVWHIGNAYSFNHSFFPPDLHISGLEFRYHFFNDWLINILSTLSGVEPWDINFYFLNPCMMLFFLIALFSLGEYCFKGNKNKILFFVLAYIFITSISSISLNYFILHVFSNVNAVLSSLVILITIVLVIFEVLKNKKIHSRDIIIISCLFFLLSGFKSPFSIMIPPVLLCVFILRSFFEKQFKYKEFVLFLITSVLFSIFYITYMGNTSGDIELFSLDTVRKSFVNQSLEKIIGSPSSVFVLLLLIPLHFIVLIPFQSIPYLSGLSRGIKNLKKMDSGKLFIYGMSFLGIFCLYIFYHPKGNSHYYFFYNSLLFINMISLDELFKIYNKLKINVFCLFLFRLFITVGIVLFLKSFINYTSQYFDLNNRNFVGNYITKSEKEALTWLKNNSNEKDVFATNRLIQYSDHSEYLKEIPPEKLRAIKFFYYTAFSGRQAFIQGGSYLYGEPYNKVRFSDKKDVVYNNLEKNELIFNGINLKQILRQEGITYIVNDTRIDLNLTNAHEEYNFLEKIYENKIIQIFKLCE